MELVADLDDAQMMARFGTLVNPLLWEVGHVAWFQEKWVLRRASGQDPVRTDSDALYDSIAIAHSTRWDLPLPSRSDTLDYIRRVRDRVVQTLEKGPSAEAIYHARYALLHEDMHCEAFTYTRQTLGIPAPELSEIQAAGATGNASQGDVLIPSGAFDLGAAHDSSFVFDNEKWAHPVDLAEFSIARTAVTQSEFAEFVDDGGYATPALWCEEGRAWLAETGADKPVYWQRDRDVWTRRHFDRTVALEPDRPMIHANWYEANAFCRWAGRRLPTEAEWEVAASTIPGGDRSEKRLYPWGSMDECATRTQMDWKGMGTAAVGSYAEGESGWGCRQMLGNVWEWTSSVFQPYPGFAPDPYKEYSEPWFETRKVLRGGSWATRSRMLRNTLRNFFTPERRDVWAGFRTCSTDSG